MCAFAAVARKKVNPKNGWAKAGGFFAVSIAVFLVCAAARVLVARLLKNNPSFYLWPKIIKIHLVFNHGTAFGLWQDKSSLVFVLAFLCSLALMFWVFLKREKLSYWEIFSFALVLGGAFSNLWERAFLGYVVDYIDLGFWPVFNLADTFISLGCILVLAKNLFSPKFK